MESRPNFYSDQDVFQEDLNQIILYLDNHLVVRQQSMLGTSGGFANGSGSVIGGGIFGSPAEYTLDKNFRPFFVDPDLFVIYPGTAIDVNGNIIRLESFVQIQLGVSNDQYSWPGSPNTLNYIKIAYQESSGSTGADDLGEIFPTRLVPMPFISVDDDPPASGEILIGTFTAIGDGTITGSINDTRLYVRIITPASAVILDPITKPVSSWTSVADHVNAKGSGVQSATNPHGLTGADIGLSDTVAPHVINSHTSGIVAINGIYDSGVYASFQPVPTDLGAEVVIEFTPPSNAGILVGGYVYTDPLSQISLLDTGLFSDGNGFYYIYANATGSVLASKTSPSTNDPNAFILCVIERLEAGSDFGDFQDLRTFRGTRVENIRADRGETTSISALSEQSSLLNNLARIRYQLGRAITGIGSNWSHANPPLTAGGTSIADAYHTHIRTSGAAFTINYDAASGDLEDMALWFYRGAANGNAGLEWDSDVDEFRLFATKASDIYAILKVQSIKIMGSGSLDPEVNWDSNAFNFYDEDGVFGPIRSSKVYVWEQGGVNDSPTIVFGVNNRGIQHFYGDSNNRGFRFLANADTEDYEDIYVNKIYAAEGLDIFNQATGSVPGTAGYHSYTHITHFNNPYSKPAFFSAMMGSENRDPANMPAGTNDSFSEIRLRIFPTGTVSTGSVPVFHRSVSWVLASGSGANNTVGSVNLHVMVPPLYTVWLEGWAAYDGGQSVLVFTTVSVDD